MWREGSVGDLVGNTWNEEPMGLADERAWSVKKSSIKGTSRSCLGRGGAFTGLEDVGGLGLKGDQEPSSGRVSGEARPVSDREPKHLVNAQGGGPGAGH